MSFLYCLDIKVSMVYEMTFWKKNVLCACISEIVHDAILTNIACLLQYEVERAMSIDDKDDQSSLLTQTET